MDEQLAHIVRGTGWGETRPIVVRVYADDSGDTAPVLVEASLGLNWSHADRQPAWTELARRADVALAQHGYQRVSEWSHHVHPQPLAKARVGRAR